MQVIATGQTVGRMASYGSSLLFQERVHTDHPVGKGAKYKVTHTHVVEAVTGVSVVATLQASHTLVRTKSIVRAAASMTPARLAMVKLAGE